MESEALAIRKHAVDFVEIVDGEDPTTGEGKNFCYTKALLKSVLQFMGCKTRVAHKVRTHPSRTCLMTPPIAFASLADNEQATFPSVRIIRPILEPIITHNKLKQE